MSAFVFLALAIPQKSHAFGAMMKTMEGAKETVEESTERFLYIHPKDPAIVSLAQKITEGETDDMQKLHSVHDWVAGNITYDQAGILPLGLTSPDSMNDLTVLKTGTGICQGYSDLTAALLLSLGIKTKVVAGTAYVQATGVHGEHAWNKAYVNGRWVILDTTWDAGSPPSEQYFDPDPAVFAQDHEESAEQ